MLLTVHHCLRFRPRFPALTDWTTRQHEKACEPHNPDRDDDDGRRTCLGAAEDLSLSEHLPVLLGIRCAPHLSEQPRNVQRARPPAPSLSLSTDIARFTGSCDTRVVHKLEKKMLLLRSSAHLLWLIAQAPSGVVFREPWSGAMESPLGRHKKFDSRPGRAEKTLQEF